MIKYLEAVKSAAWFVLITSIPGPLLLLIYRWKISEYLDLSLSSQGPNIGVILTTFSFTMIGFLAAVITILFAAVNHFKFAKYEQEGYLNIFLGVYFATMFFLGVNFCIALLSMGKISIVGIAVASTINCLIQVFLVCAGVILVWRNTSDS